MATSLQCRVSAVSAFCRPTTQTPSITNCLVAVVHTKPVIAVLVPKLVAMAGLTSVTDRQTDRQTDHATRSVTIGRICVRSTAMWPNNNNDRNNNNNKFTLNFLNLPPFSMSYSVVVCMPKNRTFGDNVFLQGLAPTVCMGIGRISRQGCAPVVPSLLSQMAAPEF